jgi:UDP-2,3-diacylglucosamine pyrophosphatase LpxH
VEEESKMLVIISDLHLGDGTTSQSISPGAFHLFAERLAEAAFFASWRQDGRYRPIDSIDLMLMGDILDPLHSTGWLDSMPGDPDYVRPWSDSSSPKFAAKVLEVTRAILKENQESAQVLRECAEGKAVQLVPGDRSGKPDFSSQQRLPIKVRIHYMVGNHDWYYHLKGEAFNQIRQEIITHMGLSNPAMPFPYEAEEFAPIKESLERYQVYARHGDIFDKFNFDRRRGRDAATLGDAFTMDVCNRFPVEAQRRYGDELPVGIVNSLRLITNIRPALATPLWISGQIRKNAGALSMERELKRVWDEIAGEFLQLDFLRQADKAYRFDVVDALEMIVKISGKASFATINDVVTWVHNRMSEGLHSFAPHALREPAFLKNKARYVVYGHTHHYEVVPLDMAVGTGAGESEVYFNSGTWRSYFDLAIRNPREQKFVPYQTLSYVAFYAGDERGGQHFETWSGTYA